MTQWNGEWHPFAERFPLMSEPELRDLAESIRENGQREPCVVNSAGLGIDGRNRVAACGIAGVEPQWVVDDGDPIRLILDRNTRRRQMSTGAQAMAVAWGLKELGLRENGRWKRGSVPAAPDNAKVSDSDRAWPQAMQKAGIILDWRDDLANRVISGALALDDAYRQAQEKRQQDEAMAAKLRRLPQDLRALVEAGSRDLDGALREADQRRLVHDIDELREADGAPPPSFAERVADGGLSWQEAASLAEQWQQERDESIKRDQERLRELNVAWRVIHSVAMNPNRPYTTEVLAGLGEADREVLKRILSETGVSS